MYNHYIPGTNGTYQKKIIPEFSCPPSATANHFETEICNDTVSPQPCSRPPIKQAPPDLGDLLVICIIVLLAIDSDGDDLIPVLIAAAVFLLNL